MEKYLKVSLWRSQYFPYNNFSSRYIYSYVAGLLTLQMWCYLCRFTMLYLLRSLTTIDCNLCQCLKLCLAFINLKLNLVFSINADLLPYVPSKRKHQCSAIVFFKTSLSNMEIYRLPTLDKHPISFQGRCILFVLPNGASFCSTQLLKLV